VAGCYATGENARAGHPRFDDLVQYERDTSVIDLHCDFRRKPRCSQARIIPWHSCLTWRQTEVLVILGDDTKIGSEASLVSWELAQRAKSSCSERRGHPQALPPRPEVPRVAADDLMTYFPSVVDLRSRDWTALQVPILRALRLPPAGQWAI